MASAVVLDIKCWSADDTSRQSLMALSPSFTSELFARHSLSIDNEESETIVCGQKFFYLTASFPVIYSIDNGNAMTGTLLMLTFDDESHTITITGITDNTKVIYISVD